MSKVNHIQIPKLKKAAILLAALDKEHLSALLAMLSGEEIQKLTGAITNLEQAELIMLPALVKEFTQTAAKKRILDYREEISAEIEQHFVSPETVDNLLKNTQTDYNVWDKLNSLEANVVSRYLKNEAPQTIAVVLSKLQPKQAADVLAGFPSSDAADIVERMLNLKPLDSEVIADVEKSLAIDLANNLPRAYHDNYNQVADILDSLNKDYGEKILDRLENNHFDTVEKIRDNMFSFEDIVNLEDEGIKLLLAQIDKDIMVTSLRAASEKLKNKFFKNMNPRARKVINEEMENLGPVKLKDIEKSQGEIVMIIKTMAKAGDLAINKAKY